MKKKVYKKKMSYKAHPSLCTSYIIPSILLDYKLQGRIFREFCELPFGLVIGIIFCTVHKNKVCYEKFCKRKKDILWEKLYGGRPLFFI